VVAVLLLFGGAALMFVLARSRELNEASLKRLSAGEEEASLFVLDAPELQIPIVGGLTRLFWRAGIDAKPAVTPRILVGALVMLVVLFLIAGPIGGVLIGGTVLLVAYFALVRMAANRRVKIIEQTPVFLENVIRVMSAGNTMEEALAASARESSDPIRPLFTSVGRQVRLGAPIDTVLAEAGTVHNLRDVKVLALATTINRRYGGSMRGVLRSLINSIRQRAMAARELRALTAEIRFSALVLFVLPLGMSLYTYLSNRRYYDDILQDRTGVIMMITAALFQVIGAIILWRMLHSVGDPEE
jgi:tight adherence protein B